MIRTVPAAGESVSPRAEVLVVVSSGSEAPTDLNPQNTRRVPAAIALPLGEALDLLTERQFVTMVQEVDARYRRSGITTDQAPRPDGRSGMIDNVTARRNNDGKSWRCMCVTGRG